MSDEAIPVPTVARLRAALADLPDDAIVVMSSDGEGNSYSPWADTSTAFYLAQTTWMGETFMDPAERDAAGYSEEDYRTPPDDAVRCVVLWPTN